MKNLIRTLIIALSCYSSISVKAQGPVLSSYPAASAVLFLDFDGQTVSNTSWNSSGPLYCNSSGLNDTQITEIFNRVSEDFRPFNINVTTDSTKYWAAPATKRMRVILTVSSSWYGSAGGVSFVGSYTWGDNTPCFIFTALLGYNPKYISEATSHESGHTLGLYHQAVYDASCTLISQYNSGAGSGETGWAPIMGVGYYKNKTTWYNGPTPYGCNNMQDDLSIITGSNGFGYRPDDVGDTFGTAMNNNFSNSQFNVNALIATNTDKDMFKFTLSNIQRFRLNADPTNVGSGDLGSNMDLSVELFNSSLNSIGYYNPPATLNVAIDTTLYAGTYYIRIDASGNNYAPGYGNLGSFAIVAQESPLIILPLRKLELHGSIVGDKHQFDWIIDADDPVTEQELEISTDGRNFSPLTQAAINDRTYNYKPGISTSAQYRLKVTFNNGREYYSNIVALHATGTLQRPKLVSNFINSNNISVNSPGNFSYAIYDFTGKTLGKGQLTNGTNNITAPGMTAGIYMIHFVNGSNQWTDKLIRQ